MMGGGFLKQMADTMKYNRELLGHKKNVRDMIKDEIRLRGTTGADTTVKDINERIAARARWNRQETIKGRIIAMVMLGLLVASIAWALPHIEWRTRKPQPNDDPDKLFSYTDFPVNDSLIIRKYFWPNRHQAAQTEMITSHQLHCESYYESRELLRSATYYDDSLVYETYFYKSGDTIKNFPRINYDKVEHMTLRDTKRSVTLRFDLYRGRMVMKTYKESAD